MASPLHQSVRDSLPVRLGDRRYNIDPQRLQRATVDPIRQGFDTQGTPGEQSLNQAGVWKRSRTDWSLGAGQLNADLNTSSDRRFYASSGVDVWTEGEVKLLPQTSEVRDSSGINQFMVTANDGTDDYIYVVDTNDVWYSTNLGGSWTEINEPAGAGAITAIASDGLNIYVASHAGSGEVQRIQGSTVPTSTANTDYWAIDDVDGLWVANGYLIASVDSRLTVLATGSAPATSLDIIDDSTQVSAWQSVIGTPVGIFAAGTQGDKSRIYYIGINDSTTSLLPPVIAAELPDGETVNVISYYGSLVCIGTTRGIRLATINGQGYLSYGPVIEISGGVNYLEAQGEFIWFNWNNYDSPFDTTNRTGLGRLSLKEFTGTIVPAYASDIMAETTGLIQGIVTTSDNRRMFSVAGGGVYLENASNANKELKGYIDEGRFTWGISDLKALVSSDVRTSKLATGDNVSLSALSDDYAYGGTGTSTSLATSATADAVTDGVTTVTGVTGEWFAPQVSLVQTATNGNSPVLHRWTLRCIPMPFVSEIIELPIILTTQTRYQNRDVYHDTYDDYVYLKSLAENRSLVTFTMGGESKTVYVAGVSYAAGSISKWSDDDDWFEGVVTVQVVTVQGL